MSSYHFVGEIIDERKRTDLFLKEKLKEFSRSQIQKWIRQGFVLCNGAKTIPSSSVVAGQKISVTIPQEEITLVPEQIPLDIIYEDSSILVLNKPAGMVTHPGAGNKKGTLANALAYYLKNKLKEKNVRLGIVHRLDKETSGVMVVAKTGQALAHLTESFKQRLVEKTYRAIVCGNIELRKGEIEGSIARAPNGNRMQIVSSGRYARTDFKVLKRYPQHTYLEVYPKTGRTHQIRLHLSQIGYPILGDKTYGKESHAAPRSMLHAYKITFDHPAKKTQLTFKAPLPKDFLSTLKSLESKAP